MRLVPTTCGSAASHAQPRGAMRRTAPRHAGAHLADSALQFSHCSVLLDEHLLHRGHAALLRETPQQGTPRSGADGAVAVGGRERGRAQSRGASSQQHPRPPRIAHPVEHRRVWLKAHRQAQGRLQLLPGHGSRVCDGHGGQQRGAPSRSKFCRGSRGPWTAPRRAALVGRCRFPARIWLPGEAATAPGSRSSTGAPCARPPLRRLPGVRRQLQLRQPGRAEEQRHASFARALDNQAVAGEVQPATRGPSAN